MKYKELIAGIVLGSTLTLAAFVACEIYIFNKKTK